MNKTAALFIFFICRLFQITMWRSTAFSSSKDYKNHDDVKYRHPPTAITGGIQLSNRLLQLVIGCLVFGVLLLFVNILQLKSLNRNFYDESVAQKPLVLIWGKNLNTGYLSHVFAVFRHVGYITTETMNTQWDVLWSHDYPFSMQEMKNQFHHLHPYQKVNHFPGSGFICNKASLAVSHFTFHPLAFEIPKSKIKFLEEVKKFPNKMWVEKSNSHRGIRIKSPSEIKVDGTSSDTFVEEFISNPYLIDGRKFDIGIYVVLTSINPLRVYAFEDEVLIRFCLEDYQPLDVKNEKQYVVGDEYTQPWELPSLAASWKLGKFSRKHAIHAHLKKEGKDADKVWKDMLDAIREVYVKKEVDLIASSASYGTSRNFFELVRFDFILDEHMKAWLMEVNMSPNLSSGGHIDNALMYEQVIFNLFGLVGVSNRLAHSSRSSPESEKSMIVADHNIVTSHEACSSMECRVSCIHKKCRTCYQCLTEDKRSVFKAAYYEHVNRGGFRRVFPPPTNKEDARSQKSIGHISSSNELMDFWFKQKCLQDSSWCQ